MTPIQAIDALHRAGMKDPAIADSIGVTQPTISKIKRGVMRPNWELGDRLVKLAEAKSAPTRKSRKRVA